MVDENEIKDWYNQKYCRAGGNPWRSYQTYNVILDYLSVEKDKKLLDVACGTGFLLNAATGRGLKTCGVDISEEAVKIARRNSPHSLIKAGKGEILDFPSNYFDYVTCLGALEHFLDIEKGIDEMLRVGKADATYCIIVPNINYIYWIIRGKKGTEQSDINEKLYSLDEWGKIFNRKGWEIANIYQDREYFKHLKIFSSMNPLLIILKMIAKFTYFAIPLRYTYQFVFLMRKKESHLL